MSKNYTFIWLYILRFPKCIAQSVHELEWIWRLKELPLLLGVKLRHSLEEGSHYKYVCYIIPSCRMSHEISFWFLSWEIMTAHTHRYLGSIFSLIWRIESLTLKIIITWKLVTVWIYFYFKILSLLLLLSYCILKNICVCVPKILKKRTGERRIRYLCVHFCGNEGGRKSGLLF